MLAIYKRELKSYFTSMTGYVFIAFFLAVIGIYFFIYNLLIGYANFEIVLSAVSFLFIVLMPILTMRIMTEDKKQKTDQLLLTSPVPPYQIVLGKYLSVLTIYLFVIAVISTYPLILSQFGRVPFKSGYASILGFFLLGASYLAVGLYISSMVESQVVSAVITFVVILLTYYIDGIVGVLPVDNKSTLVILSVAFLIICYITYVNMKNAYFSIFLTILGEGILFGIYFVEPTIYDGLIVKATDWLSVMSRYSNFNLGVINLADIVYFISIIFVFLFLTVQSLKKRRWN